MNELINLGNGAMVKMTMLKGEAGSSISSIAKTSTEGLVDTYTITLTDGSTKTFTVTNGKSIVSIAKTNTTGLVDTYTITFNNNTTTTFTVTNGKGISGIAKTTTVGLVDTYTITYNDNTTSTFTVTNGKGISSIAKTDTTGLVDTYTITYNDATTSTFTVTNGANGQDVANSNLAPVETTSTASQSYAVGQHLIYNGVYYVVTQAIASGGTLTVGENISQDIVSSEIERIKSLPPYNTEVLLGQDLGNSGVNYYCYRVKGVTGSFSINNGYATKSQSINIDADYIYKVEGWAFTGTHQSTIDWADFLNVIIPNQYLSNGAVSQTGDYGIYLHITKNKTTGKIIARIDLKIPEAVYNKGGRPECDIILYYTR